MSNTTYRAFVEKLGASDPTEFVGDKGELFWDPDNGDLNISDGKTPGGTGIKARSLNITTRFVDQFQWVSTFGIGDYINSDNNYDYGSGVAVDSNGYGYVIGGNDHDGNPLIIKYYPDPDSNDIFDNARYLTNTSGYAYGEAIAVHKDSVNGDLVYALVSKDNEDSLLLVQLDTGLNVNWSVIIDGSYTRGGDVTTDTEGNVYVSGWSTYDTGGNTLVVSKVASDGTILWDGYARRIGDYGGNRSWGLTCDGSDLYIVGRTTDSGQGGADIAIHKLATSDGSTIWEKTLGKPFSYSWEYGYGIAAGRNGIYITADARNIYNDRAVYVAKLSRTGDLIWQKSISNIYGNYSRGDCIVVDEYDNVYVSGYSDYPELVANDSNTRRDLLLLGLDTNGNLLYQKAIGQGGNDYSEYNDSHHNLAIDGEFLWITGYSYLRYADGGNFGFVARVTRDGDNEGIYGEYTVQSTALEVTDADLVLADANLTNTTSDVSVYGASVSSSYAGYDYRFTLAFRAPFELNVPNGTVTAKVVRAKEVILGDVPIRSVRPDNPYNWVGHNIYAGENAGFNDQGAYHNLVIGKYAGSHNTYGSNNIFLGKDSGYYNTTGYRNVYIGHGAGYDGTSGSYNVVIGDAYNGGINLDDSNQLMIGSNNDWWIKGDSGRSVTIKHDLILNDSGTGIYMKDADNVTWQILMLTNGTLGITSMP